ncbi:hypothetical protein AAG570_006337 [Ranatra chinensis]|uniref:Uncharacterized protein n=1 Tax=Ranatra chinensis TaxID=642074 RepID=A0ABD0YTN8_9HEMI
MGTRKEIILFQHAIKEAKYYKPYRSYRPDLITQPLTNKFYSKFEEIEDVGIDPLLLERLKMYRTFDSTQPGFWPVRESQRYGWHPFPMNENLRDELLNHHRLTTEWMKDSIVIQLEVQKRGKEIFTGVPFKL